MSPLIYSCGAQLRSLNIGGCILLTDRTIEAIRNVCGSLNSIDVSQLPELSTAAIIGLFIASPREIQTLWKEEGEGEGEGEDGVIADSDRCDPVPWQGSSSSSSSSLSSLSPPQSIGRLHTVSLQGTVNVSDEVVVHLSEMSRNTLTSLDLGGCHQLSNLALMALKVNCASSLSHLDISFVRGFSQSAVGYLVSSCISLRTLHVWVSRLT
jgi:hypothetical protein